jgi:hypothetical protein
MTPHDPAQLAAADHYYCRAADLDDIPDDEPRPEYVWHIIGGPAQLVARARRAELLDPEPSPYTIGGYTA